MPHAMELKTETAAANPSTRRLSVAGVLGGSDIGMMATSASRDAQASITPTSPPADERMRLSVSSCRTRRARPAPIDARIANSGPRIVPRARRRPATLTQAISRIKLTAPASGAMVLPDPLVSSSYIDVSSTRTSVA